MRKLVRIGSNVRIPGDLHHKNIVLAFLKKIEMVKIAMPNFCINFLNKTVKSLSILYDFAVASLADAWIKIETPMQLLMHLPSHPSRMRGLKSHLPVFQDKRCSRIPHGCVDRNMGREKLYYTH